MKKILFLFTLLSIFACSAANKKIVITVQNTGDFDRMTELVEIPVNDLAAKIQLSKGQDYIIHDNTGKIITSQTTYDGKFIFQPQLKANELKEFTISAGETQVFTPKTYGRFIIERKDDFAWENDRVAFRVYGQALIPIDGPSNGLDLWYKRTNELIIDKWYKNDISGIASYHADHGEGLDDYKVGRTLGGGAMAPYVNNKLCLNENFVSHDLLENGPLRTTFKLTYGDVYVNEQFFTESRTISIDAGAQLSKITQAYGNTKPMPVAAGIVKRNGSDSVIHNNEYIIYAEPKSESVGNVYVALVLPNGIDSIFVGTSEIEQANQNKTIFATHVLAITTMQPNEPITYYTGYAWSKFGFPAVSNFDEYVKKFTTALKQPLTVNIK